MISIINIVYKRKENSQQIYLKKRRKNEVTYLMIFVSKMLPINFPIKLRTYLSKFVFE